MNKPFIFWGTAGLRNKVPEREMMIEEWRWDKIQAQEARLKE